MWQRVGDLFEVREIADGLFQVYFFERDMLPWTLMRFQEFNDSPQFRGKHFTREEFQKWYIETKGVWNYLQWNGFNFPSVTFEPFLARKFKKMIPQEKEFLEYFRPWVESGRKFYVIGSSARNAAPVNYHEIAHALFYLDSKYRADVQRILDTLNLQSLKDMLGLSSFMYHEEVKPDECHAYLLFELETLKHMKVRFSHQMPAIRKLRELFIEAVERNEVQFDFSRARESMEP